MADNFNVSDRGNAGCRVYNNANVTIANATFTNIPFNQQNFDTDGMHDVAVNNDRITIRTPGRYVVGFSLSWDTTLNAGSSNAKIRLNATADDLCFDNFRNPGVAGVNGACNAAVVWDFAADDFIEVRVFQDTGANLDIVSLFAQSPMFYAQRIDA